jgi:hypothetical protein
MPTRSLGKPTQHEPDDSAQVPSIQLRVERANYKEGGGQVCADGAKKDGEKLGHGPFIGNVAYQIQLWGVKWMRRHGYVRNAHLEVL